MEEDKKTYYRKHNTDYDTFYSVIKESNREIRKRKIIMFVCGINAFVLFCVAIGWRWWDGHPILADIMAGIYFFVVIAYHMGYKDDYSEGIMSEVTRRLEDWRDYYQGPDFAEYYCSHRRKNKSVSLSSICNEDYVLLSNEEYMKVKLHISSYSHSSTLELTDLNDKEVYYSVTRGGDYYSMLRTLREELSKDNLTIIRVYSRFGAITWEQKTEFEKPFVARKYLYKLAIFFINLIYILLVLTPLLVVSMFPIMVLASRFFGE